MQAVSWSTKGTTTELVVNLSCAWWLNVCLLVSIRVCFHCKSLRLSLPTNTSWERDSRTSNSFEGCRKHGYECGIQGKGGDIIKPATTVASWSLIPQENSEELCKMDTSQLSPPTWAGTGVFIYWSSRVIVWRLRLWPGMRLNGLALLGSGEKPSVTRMQRLIVGT